MPSEPDSNISHVSHKEVVQRRAAPAPGGVSMPLYEVAHGRTGDKGNQVNISLIPHCSEDIERLRAVISNDWVAEVMRSLLEDAFKVRSPLTNDAQRTKVGNDDVQIAVYYVRGVSALNLVIGNALDGGVTCSRRIDRHGKSLSDLILCQRVTLPL